MKLTDEQDKYLQTYLRKALKYRETYHEVYDHMLVALTNSNPDVPFEASIEIIINTDFGGSANLPKLEQDAKRAAAKRMVISFLKHFISPLKFPKLLYTVAAVVAFYYFAAHVPLPRVFLFGVFILSIIVPVFVVFSGSREVFDVLRDSEPDKMREVFLTHKKSLKDDTIGKLTGLPVLAFIIASIWHGTGTVFITSFVFFFVLYALSIIQLYKEDMMADSYITQLKMELDK